MRWLCKKILEMSVYLSSLLSRFVMNVRGEWGILGFRTVSSPLFVQLRPWRKFKTPFLPLLLESPMNNEFQTLHSAYGPTHSFSSSFRTGVNLPARRIIIRSTKIGLDYLNKTQYLQMIGRAGRAGLDTEGDSFVFVDDKKKVSPFKHAPTSPSFSSPR